MASELLLQKKVEIYLSTPLFRIRYKEGKLTQQLRENVTHISGTILEERSGGFLIGVEALSDQKETDHTPPFHRIFLPLHKIDFIVCS